MHVKEIFDLSDHVAIVTGASSGLGVWFSRGLAEAGSNVVLAARRVERLESLASELKNLGVRALAVPTDVTKEDQVQNLVDATLVEFGRIDVLVNNAGGESEEASIDTMPMELVRQTFELNVFGVWHCCKLAGHVMLEQGDGKIINIASVLGLTASRDVDSAAYCASKGAIINFSRELAFKWAKQGVKVHCVAPGWFPTELTASVFENPKLEKEAIDTIPLGRVGGEDDIKGLIVFLASPASDFLLGHPIIFDGGQILV
ncbi:MAG: glucose 1-dehydrogenase [Anaerolineales bacterium]|nr:MAG: glucose 1-dehydrogenase [Anaerolineales bacterium]